MIYFFWEEKKIEVENPETHQPHQSHHVEQIARAIQRPLMALDQSQQAGLRIGLGQQRHVLAECATQRLSVAARFADDLEHARAARLRMFHVMMIMMMMMMMMMNMMMMKKKKKKKNNNNNNNKK